jgi:predicted RNase H-like HicB family nuclease
LVEWPEIVTEGRDIEDCRDMLRDALNEMILAYQHKEKRFPLKDIETSIGFQQTNCASKLNCGQNINMLHSGN